MVLWAHRRQSPKAQSNKQTVLFLLATEAELVLALVSSCSSGSGEGGRASSRESKSPGSSFRSVIEEREASRSAFVKAGISMSGSVSAGFMIPCAVE